jgi:hypothetical protein
VQGARQKRIHLFFQGFNVAAIDRKLGDHTRLVALVTVPKVEVMDALVG